MVALCRVCVQKFSFAEEVLKALFESFVQNMCFSLEESNGAFPGLAFLVCLDDVWSCIVMVLR